MIWAGLRLAQGTPREINHKHTRRNEVNKWMKQSVTGLILATAAVSIISEGKKQVAARKISSQAIDAVELAGGSKLKDRGFDSVNPETVEVVRAIVEA
jgi:hypothetical protein